MIIQTHTPEDNMRGICKVYARSIVRAAGAELRAENEHELRSRVRVRLSALRAGDLVEGIDAAGKREFVLQLTNEVIQRIQA